MKTFVYVCMICILSCACKKEIQQQALNTNNLSAARYTYLGRQVVVTAPTGDYTYPTSQALLWLPTNYNEKKCKNGCQNYPLIFNLYGQGTTGTDLNLLLKQHLMSGRIANGFDATAVDENGVNFQYIVFSPQCPIHWGWSAPHVKAMLAWLEDNFRIDEDRIYLTGVSAGGWGLWSCITDDESLCSQFAAIAPISSASANYPDKITNVDKYGIACWNICGDQDAFYTNAVTYTNIINNSDPPVPAVLETLLGQGHTVANFAYDSAWRPHGMNLYEWLLQYHK